MTKEATSPPAKFNRETRRAAAESGVPPFVLLAMKRAGVIHKAQKRVPTGVFLRFLKAGMKATVAAGAKE